MSITNQRCLEAILSNDYLDIIVPNATEEELIEKYNVICYQVLNEEFVVIHVKAENKEFCNYGGEKIELTVLNDPGILGNASIKSLDNEKIIYSELLKTFLNGKDVIVGIVDSGIDYLLPIFNKNGMSKILNIWDQTIQGNPPEGFSYGTEYTKEEIDQAIASDNPKEIVPHTDDTGHGTYLAGLIAGYEDKEKGFSGIATESEIVVVKLKLAKKIMQEFSMIINPEIPVYQDTDVMLGINYLLDKAQFYNKPIVIPIGLSTNVGTFDGNQILARYLSNLVGRPGIVIIVAAGDEADKKHHYHNILTTDEEYQDVNLNVGKEEGLFLIFLGTTPNIFSITIISPSGDSISKISPRYITKTQGEFYLEQTKICITHYLFPGRVADQFYYMKFYKPTPGLWTIRVYGVLVIQGIYDLWLPRAGFVSPETKFLDPEIDTTITIPSTSNGITVGAYNHRTGSLYVASGRGYTRDNRVKPNLVAPGVNIYGPFPGNNYGTMTGTEASTGIVAGACALLLEWGFTRENDISMNTIIVNNYLVKGAYRRPIYDYPNNNWGYGELDLENVFEIIKRQ